MSIAAMAPAVIGRAARRARSGAGADALEIDRRQRPPCRTRRRTQGGHFRVTLWPRPSAAARALERHRLVYAAVAALMADEVHALNIIARAPGEANEPPAVTIRHDCTLIDSDHSFDS